MEENTKHKLQQIAESALINSVVCLNAERETPLDPFRTSIIKIETTNGSGFFIDKHLIATNFHVIIGATSVKIKQSGQEGSFQIESVEAYDENNDLILLNVNCEGVPLMLGDSDTIKDKDEICVVGYPDDHDKIEHGTVESIWKRPRGELIRLTTKSGGGSSGSPILNRKGEVIGVKSSSGVDDSGNIVCSYAVPSKKVKSLRHSELESVPFEEWHETPEVRYIAEIDAAEKFRADGHLKEAIAHYDIAIELVPDSQEAYIGRGDTRLEFGFLRESITDHITWLRFKSVPLSFSNIRESISWRWSMLKLYGLRFAFQVFVSITGRRFWLIANASSNMRKAKSATDEGNVRDVRNYYQNAISLYSEAIDIEEKTGITYNSCGWVRYLLGQFENKQGNKEEAGYCYQFAIDDVDCAFKLNPKLSKVCAALYHTRGVAKAARGEHQEAIEDFNECIQLRPKKALYHHDRGISNEALGHDEAAEADFAKSNELKPDKTKQT